MTTKYILKGRGFACSVKSKAEVPVKAKDKPVVPVYAPQAPVQAVPVHTEHDAKPSMWGRVKDRLDGSEGEG